LNSPLVPSRALAGARGSNVMTQGRELHLRGFGSCTYGVLAVAGDSGVRPARAQVDAGSARACEIITLRVAQVASCTSGSAFQNVSMERTQKKEREDEEEEKKKILPKIVQQRKRCKRVTQASPNKAMRCKHVTQALPNKAMRCKHVTQSLPNKAMRCKHVTQSLPNKAIEVRSIFFQEEKYQEAY
jgi:hypothetical protein